MIVLLVEDQEQEIKRVKEALRKFGFKIAIAKTLYDAMRLLNQLGNKLSGIITDLHFPQGTEPGRWDKIPYEFLDNTKPCGFAIVAEATKRGIPVVICSDIDHHFAYYAKYFVGALEVLHPYKRIPFIMDRKDWEGCAQELQRLLKGGMSDEKSHGCDK
jgi:CheY-like chemotaxis protein